ncbi:MAG TPA: hypothetical protein PKO07_26935, partial [Pseudomonadota bacterium]|nr:hypothetical protein [Pseudomonadota bacterium]
RPSPKRPLAAVRELGDAKHMSVAAVGIVSPRASDEIGEFLTLGIRFRREVLSTCCGSVSPCSR